MEMKKGMPYGMGLRTTYREQGDGTWTWRSTLLGKELASGTSESEGEAKKALKEATWPLLETMVVQAGERAKLNQKLRHYVQTRPLVVLHVASQLAMGMTAGPICSEAKTAEAELAEKWKVKLSTHPLTKSAMEVSANLVGLFTALGWDKNRLHKWSERTFGEAYAPGAGTEVVYFREALSAEEA